MLDVTEIVSAQRIDAARRRVRADDPIAVTPMRERARNDLPHRGRPFVGPCAISRKRRPKLGATPAALVVQLRQVETRLLERAPDRRNCDFLGGRIAARTQDLRAFRQRAVSMTRAIVRRGRHRKFLPAGAREALSKLPAVEFNRRRVHLVKEGVRAGERVDDPATALTSPAARDLSERPIPRFRASRPECFNVALAQHDREFRRSRENPVARLISPSAPATSPGGSRERRPA